MHQAIDHPCIFITSSGRTGTRFFGTLIENMVEDCVSYHEPDVMTKNELDQWPFVIREFGFVSSTIGKVLRKGNLRAIGVGRMRGQISDDEAIQILRKMRNQFIERTPKKFYCEANQQLVLLADLLPEAFPNSKTIFTIRDPRDWVRSCMNIPNGWFTWSDLTPFLPNGKLVPRYSPGDPVNDVWSTLDRFQRLCWAWNAYNSFIVQRLKQQDTVIVQRFEDLFKSKDSEENMSELLGNITKFPRGEQANWNLQDEVVKQKVHASVPKTCPHWSEWSREQQMQLDHYCGDLMRQFDYGHEESWLPSNPNVLQEQLV